MTGKKDTPTLKEAFLALDDERFKILKEAIEAGKKGFKYDTKTGQRDFGFNGGGEVCRGQGRVSRKRKFKTY